MNWRMLTWKDIAGLSIGALVVGGLLVLLVEYPTFHRPAAKGTDVGFGPGWECTYPGKGDPICVKK
jgi:hypothetical protein